MLIELNTPGGVMGDMQEIMQKIIASPVPVIIYVTPSGSRAASAGFFILESADIAAMAPGTNTGAAHPVGPFGKDIPGAMGDKVLNDASAFMRSIVSKRGRNIRSRKRGAAVEIVYRRRSPFAKADRLHRAERARFVSPDIVEAGEAVQRRNGRAQPGGANRSRARATVKEQVLSFLMEPDIAFILLAIGALALYTEFNHPGAVWPGTVGIVFILLAIFALHMCQSGSLRWC